MVELVVKNLKEVDEQYHDEINQIIKEKHQYYSELFKKYDKDLTLEIIFDKSSSLYKVSASLNMNSKRILVAEEDKDAIKAVTKMFSDLKKTVKKQHEIERKIPKK